MTPRPAFFCKLNAHAMSVVRMSTTSCSGMGIGSFFLTHFFPLSHLSRSRHANAKIPISSVHPLISPHPDSGRRSMVFGLGSLSGLYRRAGAESDEDEGALEPASVVTSPVSTTTLRMR